MSFWSNAWSWFTGSSISANIAKTALIGYGVKLLSDSINEDEKKKNETVDPGVRLQLSPDTENKIPVLYGSAYFAGDITDANLSSDYRTMTYCLTLAETTGTRLSGGASSYTFNDVYLNNNRVVFKADGVTVDYTLDRAGNQDISFRDQVKIYFYANNTGIQPQGRSGTTPASHTVMPGWTAATHPMTGLIFAIVQVTYNRDKGVTGLPNCVFQITNSTTLVGDVLYDYMTNTRYGARIPAGEIDTNSLIALNAFCSNGFSYTNSLGQTANSPITINGVVDTNTIVLDNMEEMAKAAGSWLSYDIHTGRWRVIINRAGSAIASFTDSNIIGEISISGTSLTQLNNVADVKYLNNDILDKPDFVKITLPEAGLFANEPRSSLQLTLPFTNTQAVALKIGAQLLKQARVDKIINFTTDYSYINLTAGDLISVTSPVYGFTNKVFRIITAEEVEGDENEIQVSFTALEYDADVYNFAVQEFEIETNDGIIQIGSIGKPNPPQVNKIELDSRPRIIIEALTPSGVVEGMEFWLTNDTTAQEENRVYRLIATRRPVNGALYPEDTQIEVDYDGLSSSDFFIKVRGFNSQVFGPYSDPSGLIQYRPTQATQAITPETTLLDNLGQLATILTILDLLKGVDDLLGGQAGKSIIDAVLDTLFPGRTSTTTDVPGLLLEDQDYTSQFSGLINDLGNVSINELLDVDTTTIAPNPGDNLVWDGTNWVPGSATSQGSAIYAWGRLTLRNDSVQIDNSFGITDQVSYLDKEGNTGIRSVQIDFATTQIGPGYVVLATKGTNLTTKSTAKTYDVFDQTNKSFCLNLEGAAAGDVIHFAVIGQGGLGPCLLQESLRYPRDRKTYDDPLADGLGDVHPYKDNPNTVGIDHHPYIVFNVSNVYSLFPGSGKVKLFRSNGTQDQELDASGIQIEGNRVTFPFATLDFGTDYYILMDKGVVRGIGEEGETCYSAPIQSPLLWNFHTVAKDPLPGLPAAGQNLPPPSQSTTLPPPNFPPIPAECQTLEFVRYETQSRIKDSNNQKVDIQSNIKLYYNVDIILNTTGTITIYKKGGTVWQTFNLANTFNNSRVSELRWIGVEDDQDEVDPDEERRVLIINPTKDFEPNTEYYLLMTANCVFNRCGLIGNKAITSNTAVTWKTDIGPNSDPISLPAAGDSINRRGLELPFDRPVEPGLGTLKVYDNNNNLVAELPATDSAVRIN